MSLRIGNKVGIGYGKSSSGYWTTPYFAVPETGLSLMVGKEVTLYGDALIAIPIDNHLIVEYTCDIGTVSGNNLIINPVVGNLGDHSLRMVFKNNSRVIEDKTITLSVYAEEIMEAKRVLLIGDSLIENGISYIAPRIQSNLNSSITFIGSKGTTIKHEGIGGYRWWTFVHYDQSPFVKSGSLNIPAYFTDNSILTPHFVYFNLGINDALYELFHVDTGGAGVYSDTQINYAIAQAKTLIDAFLAFDANLNIILGIPTTCENTGEGWNANYDESVYKQNDYIVAMHHFWQLFIAEFANGVYNARVNVSYNPIFIDRNDGYPKTDGVHINGVHPDQSGYEQMADGISLGINKAAQPPVSVRTANTKLWLDYLQTDTIESSSSLVSAWNDKLGSSNGPIQAGVDSKKPDLTATGISGNGTSKFLTKAFTLNQPEFIYAVVKVNSYKFYDGVIFDGATREGGEVTGYGAVQWGFVAYAGVIPDVFNIQYLYSNFLIIRACFNGVNSSLQFNNEIPVTGNFGSANMGGITLFGQSNDSSWSDVVAKGLVVKNIAQSEGDQKAVYNWLNFKYNLGLTPI